MVRETLPELLESAESTEDGFAKKESIADVTKYHSIDQILARALVPQELSDEDRFEILRLRPQLDSVWNSAGSDEIIWEDHPRHAQFSCPISHS